MACLASVPEHRTNVTLPPPSATSRRPSSHTCRTERTAPSVSVSSCETTTMFLVEQHGTSRFEPGSLQIRRDRHDHASRAGSHFGAGMLHALLRPFWLECTRTMVAKVMGGPASWFNWALVFVISCVARLNALTSAWFLAMSWSLACCSDASASSRHDRSCRPRFPTRPILKNTHCPNDFRQSEPCLNKKRRTSHPWHP